MCLEGGTGKNSGTGRDAVDETLRALADARRRAIVRYLVESDDNVVTREESVEHLRRVGFEETRDELLTVVHHSHLPKLADAGLVEYDSGRQTIRYLGNETAVAVLDVMDDGP